jgi:hypothetical protein
MSFSFTKFDNVFASTLTVEEIEIDDLKTLIETTVAANGEDLPLGKLAVFGSRPSPPSPGGKGGSLRWDGNVLEVTGVEGDYDGGQMPIEEARQRLDDAGLAFIIHTTKRYTPAAPRWRVWLPFSKPLAPHERSRMVSRLNGVVGGSLSRESWALSQSYSSVTSRAPTSRSMSATATSLSTRPTNWTPVCRSKGKAARVGRAAMAARAASKARPTMPISPSRS